MIVDLVVVTKECIHTNWFQVHKNLITRCNPYLNLDDLIMFLMNRQQFTFNIYCLDDNWLDLGKNLVAKFEGKEVGESTGTTLEKCKELCNLNPECNSFAFGGENNACYLKHKCIVQSELTEAKDGFTTYYKICSKIVNIL